MVATTSPQGTYPTERLPSSIRVWSTLARLEARFMVRHPFTLLGVLASVFVLSSLNRGRLPHLAGYSTYVGMGLAPLAAASLLVAHLQTSRAQRHRTLEIEEPAPATRRARTLGHLLGALVVVPVAVALVTAYMAYLYWLGGTGQPDIGELLVGPLVVGVAGVAGVTSGTWIPNPFGGLIGLGAVAVIQIALQDAPSTLHWFAWWHTVLWYGGFDLWVRPTWAHVAYLIGVGIIVGAWAMLRNEHRFKPMLALAVGTAVVVPAGAIQSQPPSDAEVSTMISMVADPRDEWVLVERPNVTYYVYPTYERWVDSWDASIQSTLAGVPVEHRPDLVVEQWHHPFLSQLIEELGRETPRGQALTRRGYVLGVEKVIAEQTDATPIRVSGADGSPSATAVAQRAVGLPLTPVVTLGRLYTENEIARFNGAPEELGTRSFADDEPGPDWPGREFGDPRPVTGDRVRLRFACDAEGQSREVVAAWVAAQANDDLAEQYQRARTDGPSVNDDGYDPNDLTTANIDWSSLGWIQISGGAPTVRGSPTATDLAAQLLNLPPDRVAATIAANWDTWTDPNTTVQVIISEFDLEPPPTAAGWLLRAGLDPTDYAASVAAYPLLIGELKEIGAINQLYPICK